MCSYRPKFPFQWMICLALGFFPPDVRSPSSLSSLPALFCCLRRWISMLPLFFKRHFCSTLAQLTYHPLFFSSNCKCGSPACKSCSKSCPVLPQKSPLSSKKLIASLPSLSPSSVENSYRTLSFGVSLCPPPLDEIGPPLEAIFG